MRPESDEQEATGQIGRDILLGLVIGGIEEICATHNSCRISPRASLKVGSSLAYHRTCSDRIWRSGASWLAHSVTRENSAKSAGMVRRMAKSDHSR